MRVIMTSNKVGHDYPTGPLDMIQSWVELRVEDESGRVVFASGQRDARHFLEPGTFLFKAEPVDQYGNLIDRHNLWEMVGVRYRRSLFPGYSDTVEYKVMGGRRPRVFGAAGPLRAEYFASWPGQRRKITTHELSRRKDSPTNFPFKVAQLEGTLSEPDV